MRTRGCLLRATFKAEGSRRLMGQEDVKGFVGKLARMPPGLDGVGQRLRQDVSREDAADDNTGLRRLTDGSVLRREHGHVVAARGEPGRRSCGEARRSSLPVGEPLIDGDEDAHGYPPSLPPTRSSRRSVLASHVFCSAVARRRRPPRRRGRERRLDRGDKCLGPIRQGHVRLHPTELRDSARHDGLAGGEVLVDLERRAVPRVGSRPVRDHADRESRDVGWKLLVGPEAERVHIVESSESVRLSARVLGLEARRGRGSTRGVRGRRPRAGRSRPSPRSSCRRSRRPAPQRERT